MSEHGFALGIVTADDGELYRMAVLPQFRRQGEGAQLLASFVNLCAAKGCRSVYLEVRSRNTAAVALYESAGFMPVGKRKSYYGDDDALLMRRII
jgi:ribosomal-protein-alanine N-acetyltransferase